MEESSFGQSLKFYTYKLGNQDTVYIPIVSNDEQT